MQVGGERLVGIITVRRGLGAIEASGEGEGRSSTLPSRSERSVATSTR
jgi:hypothetical protein